MGRTDNIDNKQVELIKEILIERQVEQIKEIQIIYIEECGNKKYKKNSIISRNDDFIP